MLLSGLPANKTLIGKRQEHRVEFEQLDHSCIGDETTLIGPMTIPTLHHKSDLLVPHAVLSKRPNSHQFNERYFSLENPIKIGRAVAKCKATNENAIFDCKVLSRNHALIWFEHGKFYLQDTRSSNGTFVNSQRLSNANEESAPMEICSGDVVQFGVDVIENSRRVTHGCIVATLKLYLPDGSEAIKAPSDESAMPFAPNDLNGSDSSHSIANLTTINLCQLAQCLREALNREEALQAKITLLQQILVSAQENAQSSWRSLVEEERLLSRIESLQMKLEAIINSTSKKPEDEMVVALRNDLMKLHDERELFEVTAKESIQRSGEQTLLTVAKIHELEVALSSANDEVNRHKEQSDELSAEIEDLADRFDTKATEFEEQAAKLKIAEDKVKELSDTLDKEREEYEEKISEWCNKVEQLESVTKLLEFKNESQHVQLDDLQAEVERLTVLRNSEQQEVEVDHSNNGDVQTTADQILNVQNELATSNANLTNEVEILNLNNRSKEKLIMTSTNDTECCNQHQNLISQIEELKSELHRMTVVSDMDTKFEDEEDAADKSDDESGLALMEQLLKSQREVASSNSKISDLTQKVERLEQQFKERSPENGHGDETGGDTSVGDEEDSVLDKQFRINASLRNEVADLHTQVSQLQHEKSKSSSTVSSTVCDDSKLEVLHLKEQLHVSQHELIACKLKMSECTQKMDRLKQDVIAWSILFAVTCVLYIFIGA